MKKITLVIASLFIVSLFSSCVIVGTDKDPLAVICIDNKESNSKKDGKKTSKTQETEDSGQTTTTTSTEQQTTSTQQTPAEQSSDSNQTEEPESEQTPEPATRYSVKAINKTSVPVIDWCVKKDNIMIFSSSDDAHPIETNEEDIITDLSEGNYKIYFSFESYGFGTDWQSIEADEFTLNTNMTYLITERTLSVYEEAYEACRNAVK